MTAALQKELRSLRPAWLAALGLTALPYIAFQLQGTHGGLWESQTTWNFCLYLAGVLLGTELLGREFTHQTFQSLLTTPISRQQIWRNKWQPLAWTSLSILALQLILWFAHAQLGGPQYSSADRLTSAAWKITLFLCAICNALFWILLTRQNIGAIWLSLATPGLLAISLGIILSWTGLKDPSDLSWWITIPTTALASYYAAYQLFLHAQDVGSSQLDLLEWIKRPAKTRKVSPSTPTHPLRALIRKELALHQLNLLLVAGITAILLALVAALHWLPLETQHQKDMQEYVQMLWFLLWPCVPFIIGATAYAEERRLRLDAWQSVQPVSITRQWLVKWSTTLLVSLLLGVMLPLTLEFTLVKGRYLDEFGDLHGWLMVRGLFWLCGTTIGLYASTLSRSLVQAISTAIGLTIGIVLLFSATSMVVSKLMFVLQSEIYGSGDIEPFMLVIMLILGWPMLTFLSRLNHRGFQLRPEYRRYNISAITLLALLTVILPTLVIDRSWERLKPIPAPLPPLPAKTNVQPGFVQTQAGGILSAVLTPDGSLWGWWEAHFQGGNPNVVQVRGTQHPTKLHPDADWTTIAGNWKGLYAIKTDGSLWTFPVLNGALEASVAVPKPEGTKVELRIAPQKVEAPGTWKSITATDRYFAALQSDGSLWVWGTVMIKTSEGTIMPSETPVRVGSQTGLQALAATSGEILAVTSTGHIQKWLTPAFAYGFSTTTQPDIPSPKPVNIGDTTPVSPLPVLPDFTFTEVHCTGILNYGIQADGTVRDLKSARTLSRNHWRSAHLNNREGYVITATGTLFSPLAPTPYNLAPDSITPDSSKRQLTTRTDWIAVGELAIPGYPNAIVGLTADGVLWQWNRWKWSSWTDYFGLPSRVRNNCPQPFAHLASQ
jgi:hypothetical protein